MSMSIPHKYSTTMWQYGNSNPESGVATPTQPCHHCRHCHLPQFSSASPDTQHTTANVNNMSEKLSYLLYLDVLYEFSRIERLALIWVHYQSATIFIWGSGSTLGPRL